MYHYTSAVICGQKTLKLQYQYFHLKHTELEDIGEEGDNPDTCDLYVPIGCKEVYASATNWGSFRTITEYDFDLNPNNVH